MDMWPFFCIGPLGFSRLVASFLGVLCSAEVHRSWPGVCSAQFTQTGSKP